MKLVLTETWVHQGPSLLRNWIRNLKFFRSGCECRKFALAMFIFKRLLMQDSDPVHTSCYSLCLRGKCIVQYI